MLEQELHLSTTTHSKPNRYTLAIDEMSCGHCVRAVSGALGRVPGVTVRSVAVGSAEIEAPDGLSVAAAQAAVEEAGYPVRGTETSPSNGTTTQSGFRDSGDPGNARRGCCG